MEITSYATLSDCKVIDNESINTTAFSGEILMENAGQEMGRVLSEYFPKQRRFFILCGTGNNGGDGLVLARYLIKHGLTVRVGVWAHSQSRLSNLFKLNLKRLKEFGEDQISIIFSRDSSVILAEKPLVFVDALYGTGLNRHLDDETVDLIKKINDLNTKRVALDIPSGLSLSPNQVIFKADLTLTVGLLKDIFLYPWFKEFLGEIKIIPLDFPPGIVKKYAKSLKKGIKMTPDKTDISHKNSLGKSLILAGSRQYPGAANLAAKAAMVSGCGYLYLASPINEPIFSPEIIPLKLNQTNGLSGFLSPDHFEEWSSQINQAKHLLIGPGIGREKETRLFMDLVLSLTNKNIILDADGLWHIKEHLAKRSWSNFTQNNEVLITPHLGEFSYLLDKSIDEIKASFLQYLEAAKEWGCHLLVKDAYLFYWANDSYYFPFPNRYLAKAGSGDILAGFILGMFSLYHSPEMAVVQGVLNYVEKGKYIRQTFGAEAPISLMTENFPLFG